MPRTYRHNNEKSAQLGPDLCERCHESSASYEVRLREGPLEVLRKNICAECFDELYNRYGITSSQVDSGRLPEL